MFVQGLQLTLAKLITMSGPAQASPESGKINQDDLRQRSKNMLDEISSTYESLRKENSLRPGPNDISGIVVKFIPIGFSISDCIIVLRIAGMRVDPLPPRPEPTNPSPWYATEDQFKIFANTTLYKELFTSVFC